MTVRTPRSAGTRKPSPSRAHQLVEAATADGDEAALMIGSMSPDFAYFLPVGLARGSTHNLTGIVSFCLPAGLALWLLFVRVLERPTIVRALVHAVASGWLIAVRVPGILILVLTAVGVVYAVLRTPE